MHESPQVIARTGTGGSQRSALAFTPLPQAIGTGPAGAHPVAVTGDFEHHRAMEQPVQHGGDDRRVIEEAAPGRDAQVGGQDHAAAEVALGD
jgi:hypothetical protein